MILGWVDHFMIGLFMIGLLDHFMIGLLDTWVIGFWDVFWMGCIYDSLVFKTFASEIY